MPKKSAKTIRPGSHRRITYPLPTQRQPSTIDEIQIYNIDIANFNIFLVGEEKTYDDEEGEYMEPGVEYQMATRLIKNLGILSGENPKRPILIHMKTCGGHWEEGMAIYDAIAACPNPITILSYTHARSMSSLILQAADKRVLMPHSYFLFHEGALELSGTNKGVLANAEWIKEVIAPTMLKIYSGVLERAGKFSGWSPDRIQQMLRENMDKKEDVILTAWEAVEWGFADEVFGGRDGQFDWTKLRIYD